MSAVIVPPPLAGIIERLERGEEAIRECVRSLRREASLAAFAWPCKAEAIEAAADAIEEQAARLERRRRGIARLVRDEAEYARQDAAALEDA